MDKDKIYDQTDFESIGYTKLKAEFKKLGIGHVWKNGGKKADLIQRAIDTLAEMRAAQQRDMTVEEYRASLSGDKEEKEENNINTPEVEENILDDVKTAEIEEIKEVVEEVIEKDEKTEETAEIIEAKTEIVEEDELTEKKADPTIIDGNSVLEGKIVEKAKKMPKMRVKKPVIIAKPMYSREILEKNIKNINANIAYGPESHRDMLLKKKEKLILMLEQL